MFRLANLVLYYSDLMILFFFSFYIKYLDLIIIKNANAPFPSQLPPANKMALNSSSPSRLSTVPTWCRIHFEARSASPWLLLRILS